MPIVSIPFQFPPPYELPPHIVEDLQEGPFERSVEQVLDLLMQMDCADAMIVALRDDAGRLVPGPLRARTLDATGAMQEVAEELAARNLAVAGDVGRKDFMGQVFATGTPMLMMGDAASDPTNPFPPAMQAYLTGGEETAAVGFLYVLPIVTPAGLAIGALAMHRLLAAGPLNHDQPAIANALVALLGTLVGPDTSR